MPMEREYKQKYHGTANMAQHHHTESMWKMQLMNWWGGQG